MVVSFSAMMGIALLKPKIVDSMNNITVSRSTRVAPSSLVSTLTSHPLEKASKKLIIKY